MFLVAVAIPVIAPIIASDLLVVEYQVEAELLTNVASLLIGNLITHFMLNVILKIIVYH